MVPGFKLLSALGLFMTVAIPASGQRNDNWKDWSISIESDYMTIGTYRETYQPGHTDFTTHSIELDFSTLHKDGFAPAYNFPTFGIGIGYSSLSKVIFSSPLGHYDDLFHLYGTMDRELYRSERSAFGYDALLGLTYTEGRYDAVTNSGNWFFSTKVMFYVGGGLHYKWRPIQAWPLLELEADAAFRHCSSARFGYPNSGLNSFGGGITARRYLSGQGVTRTEGQRKVPASAYSDRYGLSWRIVAGGGLHACSAEWLAYCGKVSDPEQRRTEFRKWPKAMISTEAVWRYSGKFATGVSADLYWCSTTEMLKDADAVIYGEEAVAECAGYSPFSGGFGLVQECYYGPFALYVNAGAYVYRKMGIHSDHGRLWQKAGIRYYPEQLGPVFFGAACKTHNFKAEYLEFIIGVEL